MERKATIYDYSMMCNHYSNCKGCPMGEGFKCEDLVYNPDEANKIILKWIDEHPEKTYADDFFSKFPNAERKSDNKTPNVCINRIYPHTVDNCDCYTCDLCWTKSLQGGRGMTCDDCLHSEMCGDYISYDKSTCRYFKDKSKFIELPCRADDSVYFEENGKIVCRTVDRVSYEELSNYDEYTKIEGQGFSVFFDDVGKLIYRTREEAEKALIERG